MDSYAFAGLHHVQLSMPAGSESAARAFYVGVLGMSELTKPPVLAARGGCWFRGGAWELHVGVDADFRPAARSHPGVLVTSLDALAASVVESGTGVLWDDNFPGYRRFYVNDCFGNRFEFLEPLPR